MAEILLGSTNPCAWMNCEGEEWKRWKRGSAREQAPHSGVAGRGMRGHKTLVKERELGSNTCLVILTKKRKYGFLLSISINRNTGFEHLKGFLY